MGGFVLFGRSDVGADFERLIFVQDRTCGLRAVIVLHSLLRGPAFGGIRRRHYENEEAAIFEAFELAETMTLKCALADLPAGGGKAVILDHNGLDMQEIYSSMGRAVEGLAATYVCGPDVGTGEEELDYIRKETNYVSPAANEPANATAKGIVAGLRGISRVCSDNENLAGKHYLIQGLGAVGMNLAERLIKLDGRVTGCDVDEAACERAREMGVDIIPHYAAYTIACDVFMPCALGGVISGPEAKAAPWKAVCGAANNQFATIEAAKTLYDRGIYVAPDLVVNAGAVIEGVYTFREGQTPQTRERVDQEIEAIADRTEKILRISLDREEPPSAVARFMALDMKKALS